jgi:hypothetical protein
MILDLKCISERSKYKNFSRSPNLNSDTSQAEDTYYQEIRLRRINKNLFKNSPTQKKRLRKRYITSHTILNRWVKLVKCTRAIRKRTRDVNVVCVFI